MLASLRGKRAEPRRQSFRSDRRNTKIHPDNVAVCIPVSVARYLYDIPASNSNMHTMY